MTVIQIFEKQWVRSVSAFGKDFAFEGAVGGWQSQHNRR